METVYICEGIYSDVYIFRTNLTLHRIGVHLTHVASGVVELHMGDVQFPGVVAIVCHR